jgi:hypothetical protein
MEHFEDLSKDALGLAHYDAVPDIVMLFSFGTYGGTNKLL